jgi:hypothetical protein
MKRRVIHVTAGRWPGVLVIVTEERPWGVVGYMPIPNTLANGTGIVDRAFVRVETGNFTTVGEIEIHE